MRISLNNPASDCPTITMDWRGAFILDALAHSLTKVPPHQLPLPVSKALAHSLTYGTLPDAISDINPSHAKVHPLQSLSALEDVTSFLTSLSKTLQPLAARILTQMGDTPDSPDTSEPSEETPEPSEPFEFPPEINRLLEEIFGPRTPTPGIIREASHIPSLPGMPPDAESLPGIVSPTLSLDPSAPHLSTVTLPTHQFISMLLPLTALHQNPDLLMSHPVLRTAFVSSCTVLNNDVSTWPPTHLTTHPDREAQLKASLTPDYDPSAVFAIDATRFMAHIILCSKSTAPYQPFFHQLFP